MKNETMARGSIEVYGARVHNLKNIDVTIPHNSLSVITGLSGSGKSSLAFDTIFAEGQRRYIETFSAYARNMLGSLERPDVDKITGLNPVISIEQKTTNKNPRSTIGTTTEIYDFLRLLFARVGEARSYLSGKAMLKYSKDKIISLILDRFNGKRIQILAPIVKNRKGHYKELFENLRKKGYLNVRIDGEIQELVYGMKVDRYKNHTIELLIDRLKVKESDIQRLRSTIEDALKHGDKQLMVLDMDQGEISHFSLLLMDPENGLSYPEPAPHNFSFNSPQGYCPKCKGLGFIHEIDRDKVMPDLEKSIYEGGILPLGKYKNSRIFWQIEAICKLYGLTLRTPIKDLPEDAIDDIMFGTDQRLEIDNSTMSMYYDPSRYEGVIKYIEWQAEDSESAEKDKVMGQYFTPKCCPECNGDRLNRIALHYFIDNKNIADLSRMDIASLYDWSINVEERIETSKRPVASEILKEIRSRLQFLLNVGLDYLSLNRASATLSGGESQRIRLATQIGSNLVNVLYILDEPSIGLHQRDNRRLIDSLKNLRDAGNTVVVVEHDKDIMNEADYIVDIGPGAGINGGEVSFQGNVSELKESETLTASYLNGSRKIKLPEKRRDGNGKFITISGAKGNNLKNVGIKIPLGKFICVTGVSGSGKSSLINGTLQKIVSQRLYRSKEHPLPYSEIEGIENIDKIIMVDQSPLGRSPRSNPATYTGVFSDIRKLFVELPDSKLRGYKPGRFSFNVAGGRCDECKGHGYRTIEMNFLPDVLVPCEACRGKRYNRETLEVRFKGKSIADVLDMTVDQAVVLFENIPNIYRKIKVLQEIGLGYLKLGQPSSTLSGGENQRVKLATELAKKDTGKTLFILDEPTTGLHFEDINVLLKVFTKLADRGNTLIVIEHNMDLIKSADYIIDMGPEGGKCGGEIIAEGTPEEIAESGTYTGKYLKEELKKE